MGYHHSEWTTEEEAKLIEYGAKGDKSARQIGIELHKSRNSVIGKVNRLRAKGHVMKLSGSHGEKPKKPKPKKISGQIPNHYRLKHKKQKPIELPVHSIELAPTLPSGFECTMMDLGAEIGGRCRYIAGEITPYDTQYCGAATEGAGSYCPYHQQMLYNKKPRINLDKLCEIA